MDTIRNEDFSEMFHKYPATVDTYDKTGRPGNIMIFQTRFHSRGMLPEQQIWYHIKNLLYLNSWRYRLLPLGHQKSCSFRGWAEGASLLRYASGKCNNSSLRTTVEGDERDTI